MALAAGLLTFSAGCLTVLPPPGDPNAPGDPNTPADPNVPADPNDPNEPNQPAEPNVPVVVGSVRRVLCSSVIDVNGLPAQSDRNVFAASAAGAFTRWRNSDSVELRDGGSRLVNLTRSLSADVTLLGAPGATAQFVGSAAGNATVLLSNGTFWLVDPADGVKVAAWQTSDDVLPVRGATDVLVNLDRCNVVRVTQQ